MNGQKMNGFRQFLSSMFPVFLIQLSWKGSVIASASDNTKKLEKSDQIRFFRKGQM